MASLPTNPQLAALFEELADRLELVESSPFRWRAYRTAASAIASLSGSAARMACDGELTEVPGIGAATAAKVVAYVHDGTFPALERARAAVPDGLLELSRVRGIGRATATAIWEACGALSFAAVQEAARSGQLHSVRGVGPSIIAAIDAHSICEEPADEAVQVRRDTAQAAVAELQSELGDTVRVVEAGDLTRGAELVSEVVAIIGSSDLDGSELADRLQARGWSVSPAPDVATLAAVAAVGAAVRMHICEPTQVDDQVTVELGAAAIDMLASPELVSVEQLTADLHSHTDWSDGSASLDAMAKAAIERGIRVLAVTDHSAPYAMVNGLGPERLAEQRRAIAAARERFAGQLEILCGSEVEVLADGRLGLDNDTLASLDWVVASIHTNQRMDAEALRMRYSTVLANPFVDCIGHPTGRLLLRREPMAVDIAWLIEQAATSGVALELNANPRRLDLSADHARAAIAAGVPVCINTDAHGPAGFDVREHGVAVARRAGARPSDIVNCLDRAGIEAMRPRHRD